MKQTKKAISAPASSGTIEEIGSTSEVKAVPVNVLEVVMVKPSELRLNPVNEKFYGKTKVNEKLMACIEAVGINQPLVATMDGLILQGNNRWCIANELGIPEVPVIRVDIKEPIEQLEMILAGNAQRDKTNEERARECEGYLEIEAERAKRRQATNAKEGGRPEAPVGSKEKKRNSSDHVKNFAQGEAGKSREIAAKKVGWSGPTAENAVAVVKAIDQLKKEDAGSELAARLVMMLNKSVNSAALECKKAGLIKVSNKGRDDDEINIKFSPAGRSYASRQFCPFTEHGTVDDKQMALLGLTSPPSSGDDAMFKSLVALPAGFDPLTHEIGDDAITLFTEGLKKASKWNCLVETSNFERVSMVAWPDNAWVGLVASTQAEIDTAVKVAATLKAGLVWLHCRIDSESLSITSLDDFSWVVISLAKEDVDWVDVDPVFRLARKEKVPVFFDSSVKCRPHELPKLKASASKPVATAA